MVRVVLLEEHGVELKRCESLNLMMTSGSFMGSQWCQCDKQTEENSSTFCFTSQAGTVSTYAKGQSMAVAFCLKAVSPRRVSFDPTNRDAGAERVAPQVSKWCPCRVDFHRCCASHSIDSSQLEGCFRARGILEKLCHKGNEGEAKLGHCMP